MSILVLAHRGYRYDRFPEKYPNSPHENTVEAFKFALTHCMGLETDVILSKQKTIHLTHDTLFSDRVYYELKVHLDPSTHHIVGDRFIFQMDDDEIARLRMVDGSQFAKLDDLFALMPDYPDRLINLELKGPNVNEVSILAVEKAIRNNQIKADQIIFSSFNLPAVKAMREKVGKDYKIGAILAMNWQTKTLMFPQWPDAPQDAFYTPFKLEENIMQNADLIAIDPDYFILEYGTLTEAGIEAIDKFNPRAKIILWPYNEKHPDEDRYIVDIIEKFAPSGKIHAVMSDFPDQLQRILEEKGLANPV
jgi:glycerophosphoryl diester phosphodiesterase